MAPCNFQIKMSPIKFDWAPIISAMGARGFDYIEPRNAAPDTAWFSFGDNHFDLIPHIEFSYKSKFQVLAVRYGWLQHAAQEFSIHAIKQDWQEGYSWLTSVGVMESPCLMMFNVGSYMEWPLIGLPLKQGIAQDGEIDRLLDVIQAEGWNKWSSANLLKCLSNNEAPFAWKANNSAIRLAHIAGLSATLKTDLTIFNDCARAYFKIIESDMFKTADAEHWIESLADRYAALASRLNI